MSICSLLRSLQRPALHQRARSLEEEAEARRLDQTHTAQQLGSHSAKPGRLLPSRSAGRVGLTAPGEGCLSPSLGPRPYSDLSGLCTESAFCLLFSVSPRVYSLKDLVSVETAF